MRIRVHPADVDADRDVIVGVLSRCLEPRYDRTRYDWLYRRNPSGEGRAWLAESASTGAVVGVAGAFPRRMQIGAEVVPGWVLSDFAIEEPYRSLGPALELQRACIGGIDTGQMEFCYDFPSASMMAIYRRLRIPASGHMVRLALPLRVDRSLGKAGRVPLLGDLLRGAGNRLLAWRRGPRRASAGVEIAIHEGPFGEEYDRLAGEAAGRQGVCVLRSSAYLNWRFRDPASGSYEIVDARVNGGLEAYLVLAFSGGNATVVDLFGLPRISILESLMGEVLRRLVDRRVSTVSIPMAQTHPWLPLVRRFGFSPRETSPIVIHAINRWRSLRKTPWALLHCDRDS